MVLNSNDKGELGDGLSDDMRDLAAEIVVRFCHIAALTFCWWRRKGTERQTLALLATPCLDPFLESAELFLRAARQMFV